MEIMKLLGRGFAGLGIVFAAILLTGCETTTTDSSYKFDPLTQSAPAAQTGVGTAGVTAPMADATGATLRKGDTVTFSFADTPVLPPPIDATVQEDGSVSLIYNEKFQADGKTVGALQEEIRQRYVPKYFKYLTVSIKTQERWYYVGGEVRNPSRQVYSGHMDLLKAIDTAGGFTDYARKGKVQVTRANGETFYVDCTRALRHPELNREIYPGDKIQVVKRIF